MHRRSSAHSHHDTLVAGLAALLLLAFSSTRILANATEEMDPDTELFDLFLTGNEEERLEITVDCEDLADEMVEFSESPGQGIDLLASLLEDEPDPWIRFTCLYNLAEYSELSALNTLFTDLLADGRPADLWPAVLWFTYEEAADSLPHLQALWPAANRPWLRPLLVEALAWQESLEHVDEFLVLAQSRKQEEAELAGAAIDALAMLEDEAAVPVLLRLSGVDGPLGARALAALSAWPESDLAREGLLSILKSGKSEQRSTALNSLHQFDHPDVLQAKLKLVEDSGASRDLRLAAIEGLSAEDDPAVFPVLRSIATGASSVNKPLATAAWRVLKFNAQVVDDEDLRYFVHNNPPFPPGTVAISYSVSFEESADSVRTQPGLRVTPAGGSSVRCWEGPDRIVPWDDELTERTPAGHMVEIEAVYEGSAGTLVLDFNEDCWLPVEQLTWRRLQPEEDDLAFFWEDAIDGEFDIPMDETESETALSLQEAGLLDLFDPGPGTIGAALVIDENRPEIRDLLLFLSKAGDAPLLQEALAAVWEQLEEEKEDAH